MDWEPLVGLAPVQPPDAVHEVAFAAFQVRVEALPLTTELGLALKLTTGAGDFTETAADCEALPPAPEQLSV